jgi:predicted RNase H-related nuclease YkuK (DUF458 family)
MVWQRLSGEKILTPLKEAVEMTIVEEMNKGYDLKLCIGTDSQVKSRTIEFATVLVFLRRKRGGFMFLNRSYTNQTMSLRERMITEVSKSIETAYELCDLLEKYNIELEVHADINTDPSFQSNVAFKEAMGYITSMGFVFKAKPNAFASSTCADRVVN